jgi:hypothetical protein
MVGVIIAMLLGALSIYLYLKAIPYPAEIDHGPSPEAQANPYLAAEHFCANRPDRQPCQPLRCPAQPGATSP